MLRSTLRLAGLACAALLASGPVLAQNKTVKIAFIDPQSGVMAPVGINILHSYQLIADMANREKWAKGVTFEIVPFDNKLSPQESLNALKSAIDQDIRFVAQGNGSSVALALTDAVRKHNERNPGKEVVYFNYAAVDPALTNEKCNFWHFRFDANADMKMEALTSFMAAKKEIKKVYLINQDYAFGHAVRKAALDCRTRMRPDIEIVGDELHPLAKITDFSQYVAKIKASGADSVITGNWGSDLALLIKAAKGADLQANFYTYYASTTGVATAMGAAGIDHVYFVGYWNLNADKPGSLGDRIYKEFKEKYKDDWYTMATYTVIRGLADAINKAGSTDPVKVAFAFEGLKYQSVNGEVEMRAADHQLQQVLHIAVFKKVNGKSVRYDAENTGMGWETEKVLEPFVAAQPTSCNMQRPARPK